MVGDGACHATSHGYQSGCMSVFYGKILASMNIIILINEHQDFEVI